MRLPRRSLLAAGVTIPALMGAGHSASASTLMADSSRVALRRVDPALQGTRVLLRLHGGVSRPLRTAQFTMVAVTWRGADPVLDVRTRDPRGTWTAWQRLAHAEDGPDRGAEEDSEVRGTELQWVGPAEGVQVRASRDSDDLAMVLVNPGRRAEDAAPGIGVRRSLSARAQPDSAPMPQLRTRGNWGANPSWRSGTIRYNSTIKVAHVHHTVSSNNYSRADVPGMIRGMYYYHTHHLGWSDIGYNFLIDKFGRIWIGRAGGGRKPVRGAHTRGFNQGSFGVAVIGTHTFAGAEPSKKVRGALVRLIAWKLDLYDRKANGWTYMRSQGSDRYRDGSRVRLRVIDGHRDTNQTACPGGRLYRVLPEIRSRTQKRISSYR